MVKRMMIWKMNDEDMIYELSLVYELDFRQFCRMGVGSRRYI